MSADETMPLFPAVATAKAAGDRFTGDVRGDLFTDAEYEAASTSG